MTGSTAIQDRGHGVTQDPGVANFETKAGCGGQSFSIAAFREVPGPENRGAVLTGFSD